MTWGPVVRSGDWTVIKKWTGWTEFNDIEMLYTVIKFTVYKPISYVSGILSDAGIVIVERIVSDDTCC